MSKIVTNGIEFGNVANAGSKILDWYEENIWTPSFTATTPGTMACTYTEQVGDFVRIGRQVTASFRLTANVFTIGTATGALRITGLPYPARATQSQSGIYSGYTGSIFTNGIDHGGPQPVLWVYGDGTNIIMDMYSTNDNSAWLATVISGLASGDSAIGTITYLTV